MHRLRTVTLLDVSTVAGHHAMLAALLLLRGTAFMTHFASQEDKMLPEGGLLLKERRNILLLGKNFF